MPKFTRTVAVAAALPEADIDTDQILPGRFLKTIRREGLGDVLFFGLRFDQHGRERPGFVLDNEPWRSAGILISLENFGCGSSREHAQWALADFGIRAILAASFADIFRNNCFKNGILPIELPRSTIDCLVAQASDPGTARLDVDLATQTIATTTGQAIPFSIAAEKKEQLMFGRDEIGSSERLLHQIVQFESSVSYCCPSIPLSLVNLGASPIAPYDG